MSTLRSFSPCGWRVSALHKEAVMECLAASWLPAKFSGGRLARWRSSHFWGVCELRPLTQLEVNHRFLCHHELEDSLWSLIPCGPSNQTYHPFWRHHVFQLFIRSGPSISQSVGRSIGPRKWSNSKQEKSQQKDLHAVIVLKCEGFDTKGQYSTFFLSPRATFEEEVLGLGLLPASHVSHLNSDQFLC